MLFFEGGEQYHLMDWINKSGLIDLLPDMLKTKVYVGLSAGSMITAPNLDLRLSRAIYGEYAKTDSMQGLGLIECYFLPHLNNPDFQPRIEEKLRPAMTEVIRKTYVLDDFSALKVIDGEVTHIGSGKYLEFN